MMKFKVESMEDFETGIVLAKSLTEAVENGKNTGHMLNRVIGSLIEYAEETGMDDKTFIKMFE